MKKIYTCLFAILVLVSCSQAQILDGGFEKWGFSRINDGGCDCDTLPNWNTNWEYGLEDQTAQRSTEARSGSFSVLVTRSDYELAFLTQTIALSSVSEDAIQGYYRTELVKDDSAAIAVIYQKDGQNLGRDKIFLSKSTDEWTFFQFRLMKREDADAVTIEIRSGYKETENDTSKIWVDDIKFDKFVEIGNVEKSEFSIFPNPAQDQITVVLSAQSQSSEQVKVTLMDMTGRTVRELFTGNTTQTNMTFDLPSLESGMYMVKVNRANQQSVKPVMIR